MRHEDLRSTQQLRVGLIDFGTGFDRRGLERCPDQFPSISVLSEASLVAGLRKDGILPERLVEWGDDFARFDGIAGIHILFLVFEEGGKTRLRAVNFLSRSVSTVVLDVRSPRCEELLRKERVVVLESHPPLADVSIDGRQIGEAPVWIWLRNGNYEAKCALTGQIFKPMTVSIPGTARVLCQRENVSSSGGNSDQADETTTEEKAGSALVYIVGTAATLAAIILPILFLF